MTMKVEIKNANGEDNQSWGCKVSQNDGTVTILRPGQSIEVYLHSADYSNVLLSEVPLDKADEVKADEPAPSPAPALEAAETPPFLAEPTAA